MDRNLWIMPKVIYISVALRKESVDRNSIALASSRACITSLSARRAWIEICTAETDITLIGVALRKESVDRNNHPAFRLLDVSMSLSARRAWIEIITPLSGCLM